MGKPFNTLKAYGRDIRGQFAVQFAILALPLVVMTTFVVDYRAADVERVNIKTALDAAVIATINNNTLLPQEKEAFALTHFNKNYSGEIKLKLEPKADDKRVEMTASGLAPVTVADAVGLKGIPITQKSAAEIASENVICVMALSTSDSGSITFSESMGFKAPTCSVQSNSSSTSAIVSTSSVIPEAKSFCAVGGVQGKFEPYAKGECKVIEDPYKHVRPAAIGACAAGTSIHAKSGKATGLMVGDNEILYPGTYCGGIQAMGMGIKFMEGDYVMLDGPLTFVAGATAIGENVTFTMSGSVLDIKAKSKVFLKAPRFGDRAGLVFIEDTQYVPGKNGKVKTTHTLKGGADMNLLGTLYFPTQSLEVKGEGSHLGSKAPSTSFIAHDIHFNGLNSVVDVKVDHVTAGLPPVPPVLPRVEDGARLVE